MDGLRQYERTTTEQEESVSEVPGSGCSYVSIQQSQSHHFLPKPSYYPPFQHFTGCNVTIYNAPSTSQPPLT